MSSKDNNPGSGHNLKNNDVVSFGNVSVKESDLKDPIVKAILNQNKKQPVQGIQDIQSMFDEIDGAAAHAEKENQDTGSWEDVEEASEPEGQAEEEKPTESTPDIKLNYHCMKQLDDEVNTANAFINTKEMRSNEFVLQNFINNAVPNFAAAAAAEQSKKVIMTRQKKLFPEQKQSLIIAYENQLKVQQFYAEESKEGTYDIYSPCLAIDKDSHLGPARVTTGTISDVQINDKNKIFILSDNGIYSEIELKEESEDKGIKLEGSTVDLGIIQELGLDKLAINAHDQEGPKVLYGKS